MVLKYRLVFLFDDFNDNHEKIFYELWWSFPTLQSEFLKISDWRKEHEE